VVRISSFGACENRFGYINFTDIVEFKEKQKVPHSYSRAEENARFANGVRDDDMKEVLRRDRKKHYMNAEIALKPTSIRNAFACKT
jgi:hypothetical protein